MKKNIKYTFWKFLTFIPIVAFSSVTIVACGTSDLSNGGKTSSPIVTNPNSVDQFDMEYNRKHNFSNPLFVNNKIVGIDLPGFGPSPTSPGNGIIGNAKLLTKKLPNQHYVDLAKKSYALEIVNVLPKNGTAWILDYKLSIDGSYPLTWYFGSNAHVLDDLRIKNNIAYPYNFAEWKNDKFSSFNTSYVNLIQPKDPDTVKTFNEYKGFENNQWKKATVDLTVPNPVNNGKLEWEGYYSSNPKVRTVFMGNDFMSNDPKDYLDSKINSGNKFSSWFNNKEYADFGVIEVTFPNENIARNITNNYAELAKERQFKYKKIDLIQQYERKQQYVVSFPSQVGTNSSIRELMINKPQFLFDQGDKNGGQLGTSPHYSTFKSKPSILDVGIGFSYFGASLEKYDNQNSVNDIMFHNSWGLMYQLDYGNANPGASGSLSIDEDGYSLGVLFGSDPTASIGLMQAFYSSGFSYSGYYGKYNLPAYDLIRGGMPNQKKSYYDGLVMLYGKDVNFKTNLFPNGLVSRI